MVAAQTLEQAVQLLQPGTGGRAIVGFWHQRQFRQRGESHRVERLFGAYHGLFFRKETRQLPHTETYQWQQ
ncbi:hypothetical protein D3C84_606980 [compost metagenome]